MRYLLLTLFILCFSLSRGQSIQEIRIWNSDLFGLPTHGLSEVPEGQISFIKNSKGEFIATHYYADRKKMKLNNPIVIEGSRIKTFESWLTNKKKEFKLEEIGINRFDVYKKLANNIELTFPIEKDITIKIDTFKFCNQFTKERWTTADRAFKEKFTFIDTLGAEVSFIFDDENILEKN